MSARNLPRITWTVKGVPTQEDRYLLKTSLPHKQAVQAMEQGFYPQYTIVEINLGPLEGIWSIERRNLNFMLRREQQWIAFDAAGHVVDSESHPILYKTIFGQGAAA